MTNLLIGIRDPPAAAGPAVKNLKNLQRPPYDQTPTPVSQPFGYSIIISSHGLYVAGRTRTHSITAVIVHDNTVSVSASNICKVTTAVQNHPSMARCRGDKI